MTDRALAKGQPRMATEAQRKVTRGQNPLCDLCLFSVVDVVSGKNDHNQYNLER